MKCSEETGNQKRSRSHTPERSIHIYNRPIIPSNYFVWELSVRAFLSAGFQKCMPLGQVPWQPGSSPGGIAGHPEPAVAAAGSRVQPCPQLIFRYSGMRF